MKHHKGGRTLGRKKGQRTALLRSLARSLVLQEGITTTITRAKELRPFVEELVTGAKKSTIASRRSVQSRLGSPEAVKKLHDIFAVRYAKRAGGYTRIIKLGRVGKRAIESARIEFVSEK
ncbi:MAG TPA: 50S ribosomal protein L17 [Candidatus Paceibacterota bacterium]